MSGTERARDFIGRCIFRSGAALARLGGWLCGLAGTWDSMTDDLRRQP